jgi:hypothetical protein
MIKFRLSRSSCRSKRARCNSTYLCIWSRHVEPTFSLFSRSFILISELAATARFMPIAITGLLMDSTAAPGLISVVRIVRQTRLHWRPCCKPAEAARTLFLALRMVAKLETDSLLDSVIDYDSFSTSTCPISSLAD